MRLDTPKTSSSVIADVIAFWEPTEYQDNANLVPDSEKHGARLTLGGTWMVLGWYQFSISMNGHARL